MKHFSRRRFLVAAGCGSALLSGQSVQNTPMLSDQTVSLIDGAYRTLRSYGDAVWPDWTSIRSPFIYVDSEWEYAIFFPKTVSGFVPLDTPTALRTPLQVRKRVVPPDISASMDVDGVDAVLLGTPTALRKTSAQWQLTAAHEMFHVFQHAKGSTEKVRLLKLGPDDNAAWQLSFPFPYTDSDVMRLIHLQGYLSYLGVSSPNSDDARYAAGSVVDAIHVYRAYLNKLNPEGKVYGYSKFQEWTEGVAFYTEYELSRLAAGTSDEYRKEWNSISGRLMLVKHAGRAAKSRTAFYHLGMGKALLLDRIKPDWKQQYFQKNVWLDDLLEAAVATG